MGDRTRILIAVGIVIAMVVVALAVDSLRRRAVTSPAAAGEAALAPGSIPIYVDAELVGGFQPGDLGRLDKVSFVDAEEGKAQEGWLLRDVLLLYVDAAVLNVDSRISVSSSARSKSAQLTWPEVDDASNWVMFDLGNRGTLKLVSVLERLSTREQWVQDVDRIEVETQ
jgi:hypothetical protein